MWVFQQICLTRKNLHSQLMPSLPSGQIHLYPFTLFLHTRLFWQGLLSHGVSKSENIYISVALLTYVLCLLFSGGTLCIMVVTLLWYLIHYTFYFLCGGRPCIMPVILCWNLILYACHFAVGPYIYTYFGWYLK